jgi:hypothetical protein
MLLLGELDCGMRPSAVSGYYSMIDAATTSELYHCEHPHEEQKRPP